MHNESNRGDHCFDEHLFYISACLEYISLDMSSSVHRPCVNIDFAAKLVKTFCHFEAISEIKELSSYSDRNFYVRGRRSKLCTPQEIAEQGEYVLKILNSADSVHGDFVDAENEAMTFLRERNFPCPILFPMDGGSESKRLIRVPLCNDSPKEESSILEDESRKLTKKDEWCVIRLISFLPGVTAESLGNFSCENLFNIGQFVGRLSKSFQVCIMGIGKTRDRQGSVHPRRARGS